MTPLVFGPSSRRLFGLFHPAEGRVQRDVAVLLCAPMGHEAIRSHRFFRLLAQRLSRRGMSVLRFDGHGTGDSPGNDEDGELSGWCADVAVAHAELVARSGASRIIWFGARVGATLALQAASTATPPPSKIVAWEPILHGAEYLQYLREKHVQELEHGHTIPDAGWRRQLEQDPQAFTTEAFGFAITPLLRRQLLALEPDTLVAPQNAELVTIAKPDDEQTAGWVERQGRAGASARWLPLTHSMIWSSNPFPNNEMVPAEALQRIITEISE